MRLQRYDCRFCLETDEKQNLLNPCLCKGSAKYVHNECLLNWYIQSPRRGGSCTVCSYIYHKEYSKSIEKFQNTTLFVNLHLYQPFAMIVMSHWVFLSVFPYMNIPFTDTIYILYQFIWHISILLDFLYAVYKVQRRDEYVLHWQQRLRPLLPLIHTYLLLILPRTGVLGGIAANLCMIHYFYEHYTILNSMNANIQWRFMSRPAIANT